MKFGWPSRIVIVGGSSIGKTYLVWQMILRNNFGGAKKKDLEIVVTSPVEASVDQQLWQDLKYRGYDIKGGVIKKALPKVVLDLAKSGGPDLRLNFVKSKPKRKLLIIDDIDHISHIPRGREWLLNLFGTESHHSNISVVLIAHHLNIGCPAIKNSSDAIILTGLPPSDLKKVCAFLGMSEKEEETTRVALSNVEGVAGEDADSKEFIPLYNHVVAWRKPLYSVSAKKAEPAPTLFTFNKRNLELPSFLVAL